MPRVKFLRPARVGGAFFDKGAVGDFDKLDWFVSGLIDCGQAALIAGPKPVKPEPEAVPAEKEPVTAPEKPVKTNVRKRNAG
ncbi:MAG: hypothetical protein IJ233_11640 [Pyramidobacter sp.]|nr:hypothetical protein [Pyramidobacter sp.]MBQ8130580.1 hypothetical protein [Clostridia bacterium]